jgi:hypothetical protein
MTTFKDAITDAGRQSVWAEGEDSLGYTSCHTAEIGADVLAMPEIRSMQRVLIALAEDLANASLWTSETSEVLQQYGLPAHVIDWVVS